MIPVPISRQTRIASVTANKVEVGQIRRFDGQDWLEMEDFQPQILIGCAGDLQKLANLCDRGAIELSSVDTAVLVATAVNAKTLSDTERVVLWQAFAVPVYELLVSPEGQFMACECEAHAGWHLEPGVSFARAASGVTLQIRQQRERIGMCARIETAACECGRREPRLIADSEPRLVRVLAATA
jgi:hypothetical protein